MAERPIRQANDILTPAWLALFVVSFFVEGLETLLEILIVPFLIELLFLYRESRSLRSFVRSYWLDLLMLIPYFRVLRLGRLLRAEKAAEALAKADVWRKQRRNRRSRSVYHSGSCLTHLYTTR